MSICVLLIIALLASVGSCDSYGQFIVNRDICKNQFLNSCQFQPLNQAETLSDDELQCAKEYEQANVCFYHYSQCMPKNETELNNNVHIEIKIDAVGVLAVLSRTGIRVPTLCQLQAVLAGQQGREMACGCPRTCTSDDVSVIYTQLTIHLYSQS